MVARDYQLDIQIVDTIILATTGLTNGSFSKLLFHNNAAASEPVTVTESGTTPGVYHITFTPTAAGSGAGTYAYLVWETAKPNIRWTESFEVGTGIPLAADIADAVWDEVLAAHLAAGSAGEYANRVKKYATNKLTISGSTYSVKEDNAVDEFESGTITTNQRTPS